MQLCSLETKPHLARCFGDYLSDTLRESSPQDQSEFGKSARHLHLWPGPTRAEKSQINESVLTTFLDKDLLTVSRNNTHVYSLLIRFVMQLIVSRTYAFLDSQTLSERLARDALFKISENEFLLHMTSEGSEDDRLILFDGRSALLWINQEEADYGLNWQ